LPERLESTFVNEDGNKATPVLLHRAILGSFERFIGIMIENYGGSLPFWLAPKQVTIATITDAANAYAQELYEKLKKNGIRVNLDVRNEKISYKIREHSLVKTPYILAIGTKEVEDKSVSVRSFGSDKTEVKPFEEFLSDCIKESKDPFVA
jgi:threonyl-tRNA synthetase